MGYFKWKWDSGPLPPYKLVERSTIKALSIFVKKSRGRVATFTPSQLARMSDLPKLPVVFSLVRTVLEELRKHGLLEIWSVRVIRRIGGGRKYRYIISSDSPLWKLLKEEDLSGEKCSLDYVIKRCVGIVQTARSD